MLERGVLAPTWVKCGIVMVTLKQMRFGVKNVEGVGHYRSS